MRLNLLTALLVSAGALAAPAAFAAPHAAAADLADCCTPGDKDFPKVGGNLGNQNYSSLAKIDKAQVARLGGAWVNRSKAAWPPATTRARQWWSTARSTSSPRWAT